MTDRQQTAIEWLGEAGVDTTILVQRLKSVSDGHAAKVFKNAAGDTIRSVAADTPSDALVRDVVDDYITPSVVAKLVDEVVQEFLAEFARRGPVVYVPATKEQEAEAEIQYIKQE